MTSVDRESLIETDASFGNKIPSILSEKANKSRTWAHRLSLKECWFNHLLPLICENRNCVFSVIREELFVKMLLFRHYLLAAVTVILLYWPLNYLLSWIVYKRRVARIAKNVPIVDDFPILGIGPRFMRKNNEGAYELLWKKCFELKFVTLFVSNLGHNT